MENTAEPHWLGKTELRGSGSGPAEKDRPVKMTVRLADGTVRTFERAYFAAFMNLPYEGGGFMFVRKRLRRTERWM